MSRPARPEPELPIEERPYPAPFEKMFSLKHIYYIGWLCAQHATYWGLVFSWTTFFGLLRDGMCYKQLLLWLIGFLLFISSAKTTYDHFRNDPLMQLSIRTGYVFFAAGMLCTLTAGDRPRTALQGRAVDLIECLAACRRDQLLLQPWWRGCAARSRLLGDPTSCARHSVGEGVWPHGVYERVRIHANKSG